MIQVADRVRVYFPGMCRKGTVTEEPIIHYPAKGRTDYALAKVLLDGETEISSFVCERNPWDNP